MDEDLKIVLSTELEADEQASAQRIRAQLPNIEKLINANSRIKVQIAVDDSTVQSQAQKVSQQIRQAVKSQEVGVTLNLDKSSVAKINSAMKNLGVSPDISRAMTDQLDKMGIQIDKISGRWETVNRTVDGVAEHEERLLNLTIQGTDQVGRTVSYLGTYNTETERIETHLTNVTANLEKQRQAEAQLAAKAKADNESRVAYLTRQKAILSDIQATYTGATSVKPVTNEEHLNLLNSAYTEIQNKISSMISSEGQLDKVQRAGIEAQISGLKRLVSEYQNVEYIATKLKAKTAIEVNNDEVNRLAEYEEKLRSSGILTDDFKQKIAALRGQLSTAFDRSSLTAYLDSFDRLDGEVDSFKAKIQSVNALYKNLTSVSTKIAAMQKQMTGIDRSSETYAAKSKELAILQSQELELGKQIAAYQDIIQYSNQATQYELHRLNMQAQIATSEAVVADTARQISSSMSTVGTSVELVEAKFRALSNPTDALREKVANLRILLDAINTAGSNSERVEMFKRLNQEIAQCSRQITNLNGQARLEIVDPLLDSKLKKARADLDAIGRTWSSLKKDPGLNYQFNQLRVNLKSVNSQMDLRKWIAQFSAFKSEVKAAGKNVQSLGDILKNNMGKVVQWLSATTLLFRAFRLLCSAVSTIVELDTAMVDLRKTAGATEVEYRKFYETANETAKDLGVTTEAIISQTAEWTRLGHTIQEAAKLAENSAIFKSISPGMDITMATDGLVSILKAFSEIDVEDSLDGIISKINEVGKNLPNSTVMYCKKTAISVKGRRRLRPRKDLILVINP